MSSTSFLDRMAIKQDLVKNVQERYASREYQKLHKICHLHDGNLKAKLAHKVTRQVRSEQNECNDMLS